MARMKERYHQELVPKLMKEFGFTNKMRVPRLQKIVVNMGLGGGNSKYQGFGFCRQ